jgi:3-methyl-2-oxobutanoate hydroxymethyltransferase
MRVSIQKIQQYKDNGERFPVLTAYDYPTAKIIDEAEVPMILVGDSLGNVVLGYESTVFVTMSDMLHHTKAVVRGSKKALVLADMPFMSYQVNPSEALVNGSKFLQEAGAQAIKLEGGEEMAETVDTLVSRGIPVVGHIGFTPQSAYQIGQRVQGKTVEAALQLVKDAQAIADAGAFSIVLELIPTEVAQIITEKLPIPTIGIGAGPHCDSQVQVVSDMLGLFTDFVPKHAKQYTEISSVMRKGIENYVGDVKSGSFPSKVHGSNLSENVLNELKSHL